MIDRQYWNRMMTCKFQQLINIFLHFYLYCVFTTFSQSRGFSYSKFLFVFRYFILDNLAIVVTCEIEKRYCRSWMCDWNWGTANHFSGFLSCKVCKVRVNASKAELSDWAHKSWLTQKYSWYRIVEFFLKIVELKCTNGYILMQLFYWGIKVIKTVSNEGNYNFLQ